MRLEVALKSGAGRSKSLSAETLVNLYAEKAPDGAKSNVVLVGSPGLELFAEVGYGPIRGSLAMGGMLYVVSGTSLYSVNAGGVALLLGPVPGSGSVSMAENGTQLCIVANPNGYIYTVAGGVVTISDTDFPGASSVAYLDGYFIFTRPDSGQFFISALYDGTDFDALDFASAESAPDNTKRVFVDHREIWLFGETSTEIWFNSGNADFPFERVPQAIAEKGIAGAYTTAKLDNSVFWLDNEGMVRRAAEGYTPVRVSTHEIESTIAAGDIANAEAFSYTLEGHESYCLYVPGAGTFIYDAATNLWHSRVSHEETRWRAHTHTYIYGKRIVGDFENGNLYALNLSTFDEAGEPLVAEMVFPPVNMDGERFTVASVQLDCEVGVGLESGADPLVSMQTSHNGVTWGNESFASMGTVGNRRTRAIWRRLGQYRNMHLRFRIADPVKRAVYTAYVN